MLEDLSKGQDFVPDRLTLGLTGFASDVVSMLVARGAERPAILDAALLAQFKTLLLRPETLRFDDVRQELRRSRITPDALVELYIPAAARDFGDAWVNDTMSFSQVTLGSSRLQALLHELSADFGEDERHGADTGTVLVVIPEGEQHTLGGLTLVWQLRRRGVSVCLQIAPEVGRLCKLVADRQFDGVFLSISSDRHFDTLMSLVTALKNVDNVRNLPVVIGGAVTEIDAKGAAMCGADLVTSNMFDALALMGVGTRRPRAGRF